MDDYSIVIGGKAVATGEHFEVLNPSTGAVVGRAPRASRAQLDDAVDAATTAFKSWSKRPDTERKALCHAVGNKIGEHAEELARLLTMEQGKPLNGMGSRFELGGAQAWAHYTADLDIAMKIIQDNNEGRIELHRKPVGVVGSITPWNWPLMIAIWHIIPAIRAGNTVVNKPSPLTPLSTLRMIELMQDVLPPGVVSCVAGEDLLGARMSEHPDIGKIAFTGSSATGRKIMSAASQTLKRLTLELGGNDAAIVLSDADPGRVAEGLFWGAFINNGQTCAALKRLYVHDDIYDDVCRSLTSYARNIPVGDGLDEKNVLGPIQNAMQHGRVERLVAAAKSGGGRVLLGGESNAGLFFPLTLIADLDNGNALVDEEQFGPVLPIIRYTDVDEAVQRANDNPNGLGGSIWSANTGRAREIALELECGTAWINRHGAIQPNAPFGGVKGSGFGVEFGEEGLLENTTMQTVYC